MRPVHIPLSALALALASCGEETPPPATPAVAPVVLEPRPAVGEKAGADAELAERVKRALEEEAADSAAGIDVTASGGVVRLFGTVGSPAARLRAEEITAGTPGVKQVQNQLVVLQGS